MIPIKEPSVPLLIAAGSVNYTGAAMLAGKAAYRVGAGLVTMAVPSPPSPRTGGTISRSDLDFVAA